MTVSMARKGLPALILAMSASAWLVMWQLGDSPWGHWLHSHVAAGSGGARTTNAALRLGSTFVASWIVMTTAMMLPTILPLVEMFQRLTAARPDRVRLAASLIAGYLAAWAVCGVLVFAATLGLQALAPVALATNSSLVTASLFVTAGGFQFSKLKYACLEKCRSPLSFLTARWRGTHQQWHSFRLGVEHGVFCVGCCWALMLLMFAVGAVNLLWMLALAGVMAIEKNMPWGRQLSAPLGIVLLISGVAIAIVVALPLFA